MKRKVLECRLIGVDLMNEKTRENFNIENTIKTEKNGCKLTISFSNVSNAQIVNNVLENLLDTFERRIKAQTGC